MNTDKWLALAALLAPRDGALAQRLRSAVEDPAGYVKLFGSELLERGIVEPTAGLERIALLDGLEKAKCVALLDAKSPASDVALLLKRLKGVKLDWAWMTPFDPDARAGGRRRTVTSQDRSAPQQGG